MNIKKPEKNNPIRLDFASSYTGNYFLDVGAANDNGYGWYEISLDLIEVL